jgi:hypothetical protein
VNDYIENPKTQGSGIVCAIPQKGRCPMGCADCFFQSGRSYLEPLEENTPNMPSLEQAAGRVVRVNDGNDSSNDRELVERETDKYRDRFFNTSDQRFLGMYPSPVVLTVNPGNMTDSIFFTLSEDVPKNLMFVRVRVNTWNLDLARRAIRWYAVQRKVPVVLTFMAYWGVSPTSDATWRDHQQFYEFRRRTLNEYWCIRVSKWREIMHDLGENRVYSCSGPGPSGCKHCGNCLREYYATKERMGKKGRCQMEGQVSAVEKYQHHGIVVSVRSDLKGRHREHCLCFTCSKFTLANRDGNCSKANALYALDVAFGMTTPVWECPDFDEKGPAERLGDEYAKMNPADVDYHALGGGEE